MALSSTTERDEQLDAKVDDLHPTEDGEASEKAHGTSYQAQLSLSGHLKWTENFICFSFTTL